MKKTVFLAIYRIAGIGLILYGAAAVIAPVVLFEPFSQHVYQFPEDADLAVTYLKALFRLLGYFNLIYGILCLILLHLYRENRKLNLVIFILPLAYLGPIAFDNTVGSIGFFEIIEHVLFAAMIVAGAAILIENRNMKARVPNPL